MDVKVTYLQMFAHPARIVPPPRDGLTILHAKRPTIAFSRFLYDAVGRRRQEVEIELVQFGLIQEFIGQGLGRSFLQWTIDRAWNYGTKRFWLHTCDLDPAAFPNYKKAGVEVYKEEMTVRGPIPPDGTARNISMGAMAGETATTRTRQNGSSVTTSARCPAST
jgi:GNAT superfamily N-acetyltransferase